MKNLPLTNYLLHPTSIIQLPPVCHHQQTKGLSDDQVEQNSLSHVCKQCHLAHSPYWKAMTKFELKCHPRFVGDADWAVFMNIIRERQPTAAELAQYFDGHVHSLTKAQAEDSVCADMRALCSHREDVTRYNNAAAVKIFGDALVDVPMATNAAGLPALAPWLAKPKFHELSKVAIGACVSLTSNLALDKGAANGATGTVTQLEYELPPEEQSDEEEGARGSADPPRRRRRKKVVLGAAPMGLQLAQKLLAIHVKLDGDDDVTVKVRRTHWDREWHDRHTYFKSTFPLILAYALTGHRAQGATITGKVIVDVRNCFAPGLLYVMLSRICSRDQVYIVGRLTPDMFRPIIIDMT